MRKYLNCVAIIGAMAVYGHAADSSSTSSGNILKTLEQIQAKAGISFGGEFQSQFLSANIDGDAAKANRRNTETAEFTSVDFDIKARPNTITQGRLIFRMQQDWRNFYSDISNPIFARWLSIDGTAKGMFSYNAGMFKQKYTPLTLYTPEIDVLYEPDLFAQQRRVAKNEVFLDDNQRLLQGINLNFGAEVYPIFNSLKVNAMATRLRAVETNIKNGSKVVALIDTSAMEKFMAAGNADITFLRGISAGGSFLDIFDNKASYSKGGDTVADTMAQNTRIGDLRIGVDIGTLANAKNWKLGVSAEMAFSSDDSAFYDTIGRGAAIADTAATHQFPGLNLAKNTISGSALKAQLNAAYSVPDVFNISLEAGFIKNTSDFRNELAQSPSFFGRRIMNFENDTVYNVLSSIYSTFDAMYQQVFKFAPAAISPTALNWWYKEPFMKNSYTSMVFTQQELAKAKYNYFKSRFLDPSVQLVMPFGPATPNRTGVTGHAAMGFLNDRLQAKAVFASLKEIDTTVIAATATSSAKIIPKTTYSQAGGGIKIQLEKFIGWQYPINISSSVVSSKASNDGILGDTAYPAGSIVNNFYAENIYFKFWKRAAFLFGMEFIKNDYTTDQTFTMNQTLTAIGLEYKVSEGSYVTGTLGQVNVTHSGNPTKININTSTSDFNQKLVSLYLRVMF